MDHCAGVLLVNLGTPDSPHPKDVYRYLIEFLTDGRVIDTPWLSRQLLVRGIIVPFRYKQTAQSYKKIWTSDGSPLLFHGDRVKTALQNTLGNNYLVELAMRYQNPSIEAGISQLIKAGADRLIIVPLFPQYASATTGSIQLKVMEVLSKFEVIPETTFTGPFFNHPGFIQAFCEKAKNYPVEEYDHILFSFHGLPQRQLRKASPNGPCFKVKDCCKVMTRENRMCYAAQCYATARGIAGQLKIPSDFFSVSYQSRLGRDPWLTPYASETITSLARSGCKKLLVFSPSFVCDCLETIFEIGEEYAAEFKKAGGETLDLVEGLNDCPRWIEALKEMVLQTSPLTATF